MENLAQYFSAEGYTVESPAYRYHDPTPVETEAEHLIQTSIADYVDDIATVVSKSNERPILIGHSLGGIVAQHLASRGLARAIILLNGSVNAGTLPTTDEERTLVKALISSGPFWERTLLPDFATMAKYGLNKLPVADQHRVFDQLGPESGRVMFELFLWMFDSHHTTRIDYSAITCPVLMVSGSEDLAIPPSTARLMAQKHRHAEFHIAEGFGHYMQLEPRWREIATLISNWMQQAITKKKGR